MIRIVSPLVAISLVACAGPVRSYPIPPTPCGAEKVAQFVGKKRSDAIAKQIAELSGAKGIRWIEPGMAVTMDYREDRLNVQVDEKGVIQRVYCS